VIYLILADAAQAAGGKLFILGGGWTTFRSASFPAPIQLAVAASVVFSSTEVGIKYPLSVIVSDETGVPIIPEIKGQVEATKPATDVPRGAHHKVPLAINLGLSLPHPGRYGIVVTAGSSRVGTAFDAIYVGNKVEVSLMESRSAEDWGN
jgi:hypothetical protein